MKRSSWSLIIVSCFSIFLLSACDDGYVPNEGENCFRFEDVYRVLTLKDEEPELSKEFPIHSYMRPMTGIVSTIDLTLSEEFPPNSIFFDEAKLLNREGIEIIYNMLNIMNYEVTDELFVCEGTGLLTYNPRTELKSETILSIDMSGKPAFTVYGDVADVYKYTFSYEDRAIEDGEIKESGEINVYLAPFTYFDEFIWSFG